MEELAEREKQNNPDVTSDADESMVVTVDDDDDNTDAYTKMVNYLSNNMWFNLLRNKNIYICI